MAQMYHNGNIGGNRPRQEDNILSTTEEMQSDEEKINLFLQCSHFWYSSNLQQPKLMQFKYYLPQVLRFCQHKHTNVRVKAVRTLAFISGYHGTHEQLINNKSLTVVLNLLRDQPAAGICEAGLVFVNHLCAEAPNNNVSQRKDYITKFFQQDERLFVLLRYTTVEDDKISILTNAFCAVAAILNDRLNFQEAAIKYGLLSRAMELQKTRADDGTLQQNINHLLANLGLHRLSYEIFEEYSSAIEVMGFGGGDLAMALWYLGTKNEWSRIYNHRKRHPEANSVNIIAEYVVNVAQLREQEKEKRFENIQQIYVPPNKIKDNNQINNNNNHRYNHQQHQPQPRIQHSQPIHAGHSNNNNNNNNQHQFNNAVSHPFLPGHGNYSQQDIPPPPRDPYPGPNGHPNGYPNGHPNGHHNGHHNGHPNGGHPNQYQHRSQHSPIGGVGRQLSGDPDQVRINMNDCNNQIESSYSENYPHQSILPPLPLGYDTSIADAEKPPTIPNFPQTFHEEPSSSDESIPNFGRVDTVNIDHIDDEKELGYIPNINASIINEDILPKINPVNIRSESQQEYPIIPPIATRPVSNEDGRGSKIDAAILYSEPLNVADNASLQLTQETDTLRTHLENLNCEFNLFVGVLTKTCLSRCMQRGAKMLHISGHGPPEDILRVEDKLGGCEQIEKKIIERAMEHSGIRNLKLVFVSMCYSRRIAEAFVEANVDHVICIHGEVEILDDVATKFASTFYESLTETEDTIQQAFDNAKGLIAMNTTPDCCCKHTGHKKECHCDACGVKRCCKIHHNNQIKCMKKLPNLDHCCHPDAPHKHEDKFLLLGNGNHNVKLIDEIRAMNKGNLEVLDPSCDNNIKDFSRGKLILGRYRTDVQKFVVALNPLNSMSFPVAVMFARRMVGTTTVANLIGKFFARPWYEPIFPGGVWYVDFKEQAHCVVSKFFQTIAATMNLEGAATTYAHIEMNNNNNKNDIKPIPYPKELHSKLKECQQSSRSNTADNHYTVNFGDEHHWIFFKKATYLRQRQMLKQILLQCDDIEHNDIETFYKILKENEYNNVDIARLNNGQITVKKILVNNAAQVDVKKALIACKNKLKLIIVDHVKFETKDDANTFVDHLNELVNDMKCRVLVVFHEEYYKLFEGARLESSTHLRIKEWRLHPVNPSVITDLIEKFGGRQLRSFDWDVPPKLQDKFVSPNFLDWRTCHWATRAPKLVTDIVRLMGKRVPLWVLEYICLNCENGLITSKHELENLLKPFDESLFKNPDTKDDAVRSLIQFAPPLRLIMDQWVDADGDEKDESNINNDNDNNYTNHNNNNNNNQVRNRSNANPNHNHHHHNNNTINHSRHQPNNNNNNNNNDPKNSQNKPHSNGTTHINGNSG